MEVCTLSAFIRIGSRFFFDQRMMQEQPRYEVFSTTQLILMAFGYLGSKCHLFLHLCICVTVCPPFHLYPTPTHPKKAYLTWTILASHLLPFYANEAETRGVQSSEVIRINHHHNSQWEEGGWTDSLGHGHVFRPLPHPTLPPPLFFFTCSTGLSSAWSTSAS